MQSRTMEAGPNNSPSIRDALITNIMSIVAEYAPLEHVPQFSHDVLNRILLNEIIKLRNLATSTIRNPVFANSILLDLQNLIRDRVTVVLNDEIRAVNSG